VETHHAPAENDPFAGGMTRIQELNWILRRLRATLPTGLKAASGEWMSMLSSLFRAFLDIFAEPPTAH